MRVEPARVQSILTRSSGYLESVCSHSLQPYRGCPFGKSLCGVACYVQHNVYLTKGLPWGTFLNARVNAADIYRDTCAKERVWARKHRDRFVIFLSSATEPFPPQEARWGVTRGVLEALRDDPPDGLIVQTHSARVIDQLDLLGDLAGRCSLRVHLSIETDRERLAGFPGHASSIEKRFDAAGLLKDAGLNVVITVSPLLPIEDPDRFFARVALVADAVVLDHFIEGDGTSNGSRTLRTPLPDAIAKIDPASTSLSYRDTMARVAEKYLPGKVGISREGFAGRYGKEDNSPQRHREHKEENRE